MTESLHKHPRGIRFRPGVVENQDAVNLTKWLVEACNSKGENGFHSWLDVSHSGQRGMWFAINIRTFDVYVEARD